MDALIQKKYFIGKSGPGVWSSVYNYKPQGAAAREHRGEIFAVIALKGPKEFALATAGNMLLDHFHESYFENTKDSVMISLEKALIETSHYLQKFLENDVNGAKGVEFDLTALTILDDLIYVVSLGSGKVYVYRDEIISDISDSLKDPTGEGMIREASFIAKKGDAYLLGTPRFAVELKDAEIEQVVSEFNEKPLKNRMYKEEAEIGMLLIGYNFERKTTTALPPKAFPEAAAEPLPEPGFKSKIEPVEEPLTDQELATEELQSGDAAAQSFEAGQETDLAEKGLEQETILPYEEMPVHEPEDEQTLEELINGELQKESFPLEHEENPAVDLKEEDDLEEVLIDESSEMQTQEDMRFPEHEHKQNKPHLAAGVGALAAGGFAAKLGRQAGSLKSKAVGLFAGLVSKIKPKAKIKPEEKPEHLSYDPEPVPYEDEPGAQFEQQGQNYANDPFADENPEAQDNVEDMDTADELEFKPVPAKPQIAPKSQAEMKTYQVFLMKVGGAIKKFLGGVKALVWDKWLGMGVDKSNIYLRTAARKRKWGLLVVLILVIGCLLWLSINSMVTGQKTKAQDEKSQGYLNEAIQLISGVDKDSSLYARMAANDARKQTPVQNLATAEGKLTQAAANTDLADQIAVQRAKILALRDKMNRIIPETDPTLVLDLGAKFPNANITDMVIVNKTIYFIDDKDNTLFSSDYSGNYKQVANGFQSPRSITADEKGNIIVMDANTDKGLSVVTPSTGAVTRLAATSQSKIGGATQIEFAMINKDARLYLLNPQQKAVYYYSRTGSSYSTITKRMNFDELATATDFNVIDGRFYFLLQKNLGLYRFYDKGEDVINLSGLAANDNLLSAKGLSVDGTSVYVADASQKRILVFSKGTPDIALIAQYSYRGKSTTDWANLTEIQADRESGRIFVLDKTKIFSVKTEKLNDFQ